MTSYGIDYDQVWWPYLTSYMVWCISGSQDFKILVTSLKHEIEQVSKSKHKKSLNTFRDFKPPSPHTKKKGGWRYMPQSILFKKIISFKVFMKGRRWYFLINWLFKGKYVSFICINMHYIYKIILFFRFSQFYMLCMISNDHPA